MSLLLRTIEAFPRGRSTEELMILVQASFDHHKRLATLSELGDLTQSGQIRKGADGKWRARSPTLRSSRGGSSALPNASASQFEGAEALAPMKASPARFSVADMPPVEALSEEKGPSTINPQALVKYYRSAVRSDPRGALTQTLDTYGTKYVFLTGAGNFWPDDDDATQGRIVISLDSLPDQFREALTKRDANENTLAVGWPIAIGEKHGVPAVMPVGLVAAEWERTTHELVINVPHPKILANPEWLKSAARTSRWKLGDLDSVFRSPDGVGLPQDEFLQNIKEAVASSVMGPLSGVYAEAVDPAKKGIVHSIGLFLPDDSTFTVGAVRDLDAIGEWSITDLAESALGPILGLSSQRMASTTALAPINLGPLNGEQLSAAHSALSRPLTVITGPPGTGKSQVIVSIVASALQNGQTVLVASKNHQALDAVEQRLGLIASEVSFMVRTLDPANERDNTFEKVLNELVSEPLAVAVGRSAEEDAALAALAQRRWRALRLSRRRKDLHLHLARLIDRVVAVGEVTRVETVPVAPEVIRWWQRLYRWLTRALWRERSRSAGGAKADRRPPRTRPPQKERVSRLRRWIDELPPVEDPIELGEQIERIATKVVGRTLASRARISRHLQDQLGRVRDDMKLRGQNKLPASAEKHVVSRRPLWLASVLGTPKRIPLTRGLFDLVIFDEASQCDIGSALPLMARAKRLVVVGDDRQLTFIPQLSAAKDRNLMMAQQLPLTGMGRYAQGLRSLFDLASSSPTANRILLRKQYRSDSEIVAYISEGFYGGLLEPSADARSLKKPRDTTRAIAWEDVRGAAVSALARGKSAGEAIRIIEILQRLLVDEKYQGTIGVITPFRAQVDEIKQRLKTSGLTEAGRGADLRVSTVDGFQGQERDVILFSTVVHVASPSTTVSFLQKDWRRLNVAISRARAAVIVVGDLSYARSGKIRALAKLADRATRPLSTNDSEAEFDSQWERAVYHALLNDGLEPKPQYEIAGRRLDFALFGENGVKLDLEVDGRYWHQDIDGGRKSDDIWRDHQLRSLGWRVRRFWVDELDRDMEGCIDVIKQDLR